MFVTEVIPLRRGIGIDTLSYFGSESYPVGTLLRIPVRNQTLLGLVSDVHEVSAAKTAIRAATFSLRKLPAQTDLRALSPAYINTATSLARLYSTNVGSILFSLLPPEVQHGDVPLPHAIHVTNAKGPPPEVLIAKRSDRYGTYRSIVRETFAHGGSVVIVVPTSIEAADVREALMRGIEDRLITLTASVTKRALRDAYRALEDLSQAKLIIATPSHAMIERHDVARIIIEEARSPHYRERVRPYLDYRDVLTTHARESGRSILLGDILPRTEDEHERRTERYLTYGDTPKRVELGGKLEVVLREERGSGVSTRSAFDPRIESLIRDVKKKKKHLFIFSARRGLAPVVTCQDCGYVFRSPASGAPYSLLRTVKHGAEERWFICGTSGERVRAADTCPECGSWKLRERGIGIQYVHDELKKLAHDTPLIVFDHTTATTFKKACFLRETFYGTKGAIMLGTAMALPYLTAPIDASVIVSLDALLTTPTWRLDEENLALLLRLREVTTDTVYLQSRTKEHDLFGYARHAEIERFYTDEIAVREACTYPPFAHFVHLTWQGTPDAVKALEAEVRSILDPFSPSYYPSPHAPREAPIMHALIRVPAATWPDVTLVAALKQLPPSVRVMHNPDRIV